MMTIWDPAPDGTPAEVATYRKRLLPTLDGLLPDEKLARAVARHTKAEAMRLARPRADPHDEPLTLVSALLTAREVAEALELQLALLVPGLSSRALKQLRDELPNDRDGLLNTMSEMGLTIELLRQGWAVECASPFWRDRDVDLAATKDGITLLIEVVNAQSKPMANTTSGFLPMCDTPELVDEMVRRVASKALQKFRAAFEDGWDGPAWIAVDATKNDEMHVSMTIHDGRSPDWRAAVAERLGPQFPELAGVLFYRYSACAPCATDLRWHPCAPLTGATSPHEKMP